MEQIKPKIKICGLTTKDDICCVNRELPDFIGMVLYFPKSKRNLSIEQASVLMKELDSSIKKVAVCVSPTAEQIHYIEETGFDFIQIHGELPDEILNTCSLPVLRAFNVSNMDLYNSYLNNDKIAGFVFDAAAPGSGKTFDWNMLNAIPRTNKLMFLAGGINTENVKDAIEAVHPDVIDVSSSVEYTDKPGKDPAKVHKIVNAVRGN